MTLKDEASSSVSSEAMILAELNFEVTSSQLDLGKTYYSDVSVEENCVIAFKFTSRSAEQGNAEAQFILGNLYALGHGTKKNHEKAYMWYTKSAIQGYKKALIRIHNLYQEDIGVHCRGQLNSDESEWNTDEFKQANQVRELNEYRLKQMQPLLNGAIEYYTDQFKKCQTSNQEDPETQQNLGFLYQHGYGVKKATRWAIEYYTKAAEKGLVDAQYNLGYLYQHNTDIKFNYRKAFRWYEEAAKAGQNMAQKCLAYFYENGLSVDIDYDNAILWYLKAANAGNSEAQLSLGRLYRKGQYVKKDHLEAVKWYSMAARQGNNRAQNCLIQMHINEDLSSVNIRENIQELFTRGSMKKRLSSKLRMDINLLTDCSPALLLKPLAMHALKGDGNAMLAIGLKYFTGEDFCEDKDTGFKWIKNAAKAGIIKAQKMIIEMLKEGKEVEQDYHKMSIWTQSAAKKNNINFQCQLGILYNKGFGVRYDPLEASKWFTLSAAHENSDAQYQLGLLRFSGRGLKQDLAEAMQLFYRSALQGNIDALYELGKSTFYGVAVNPNIPRSLKLFEYAASNGNLSAQLQLGKVFEERQDNVKAIEFYELLIDSENGFGQYVLALKYLKGGLFDQDFEKAFSLFKSAAERDYFEAKSLFVVPIIQRIESLDYSLVVKMFSSVTQKGIASMGFNIGFIYEHGWNNSDDKRLKDYKTAITWYRAAAIDGDSRAMYRLGVMYEDGKDGNKDLRLAIEWYSKAGERGEGGAKYRLACMYLDGRGVEQSSSTAFDLFTEASNMGHQEARKTLLLLNYIENDEPVINNYGQEEPVKIDFDDRMSMLENVAANKNRGLSYQLGRFYEKINNAKAIKWYRRAIKSGISDAYFRLAKLYEKNRFVSAIDLYKTAAEYDHEHALFRLAQIYNYGLGDINYDYSRAYKLYTRAANLGFHLARKLLNTVNQPIVFTAGEEIKDSIVATSEELEHIFRMLEFVAEQGDRNLQCKLGDFYEKKADYSKAFYWYSRDPYSHKESMHKFIYKLGQFYEEGLGVERDYEKSIEFYVQAKNLGSVDALFKLGMAYHKGYGVTKDSVTAIDYYVKAAKNGQLESQYTLGKLYETGELVGEKDLLEAIAWYTRASLQGHEKSIDQLYTIYDHEPYETYFYEKLFQILQIYERLQNNEDKRYSNIYGSMYFKLGLLYDKKQNYQKSYQYFSKSYNVYKNTEAENFATLAYTGNGPDSEEAYRSKLDIYWSIMDVLDDIQQHKLGMIYYEGTTSKISKQETPSNSKQNITGEDLATDEEGVVPFPIKTDKKKAERYFTFSALQGNQSALLQFVEMLLKDETKSFVPARMLEALNNSSVDKKISETDASFNALKTSKKK